MCWLVKWRWKHTSCNNFKRRRNKFILTLLDYILIYIYICGLQCHGCGYTVYRNGNSIKVWPCDLFKIVSSWSNNCCLFNTMLPHATTIQHYLQHIGIYHCNSKDHGMVPCTNIYGLMAEHKWLCNARTGNKSSCRFHEGRQTYTLAWLSIYLQLSLLSQEIFNIYFTCTGNSVSKWYFIMEYCFEYSNI